MAKFIARKPEKEVISMRISVDILEEVDRCAPTRLIVMQEILPICLEKL